MSNNLDLYSYLEGSRFDEESMLALHKQSPHTPQEQDMVKREIESTDRGIDKLVYEFYGLNQEEIKIVKGER